MEDRYYILANGEAYIDIAQQIKRKHRDKDDLPAYETVRDSIISDIERIDENKEKYEKEIFLKEIIVEVKLQPGFFAKSYYPEQFIKTAEFVDVGSYNKIVKKTTNSHKNKNEKTQEKTFYMRTSFDGLTNLKEKLKKDVLIDSFKQELRMINSVNVNVKRHFTENFKPKWESGRVEVVMHPFNDLTQTINSFLDYLKQNKIDMKKVKYKSYEKGPTFFSIYCNKKQLDYISRYNPVRTVHPLEMRNFSNVINDCETDILMPLAPDKTQGVRSKIKIGVFDGGCYSNKAYIDDYVEIIDSTSAPKEEKAMTHGTSVVSTILYGDLFKYSDNAKLSVPELFVVSYRVLPTSDKDDMDLYEVIDTIEAVVPSRDDIKVYNLSIGPAGPIEDDNISRFTYALDKLAYENDILFCCAVGNMGDVQGDANRRIEAPADIVNGLGVGAYSYKADGTQERAYYSCIGQGREGCKVKPDVMDFGGDESRGVQVINAKGTKRLSLFGTSFASPLVSKKLGNIIGRCSGCNSLVARNIVIHAAELKDKKYNPNKFYGYGLLPNSIEDIIKYEKNKVTILYSGRMLPTKYLKLKIPYLDDVKCKKIKITWTISLSTAVVTQNSGDYTSATIEDYFYPNSMLFNFSNDGRNTKLDLRKENAKAIELLKNGWTQGTGPAASSPNKYKTEQKLRDELKWDTVVKKCATKELDSLYEPYLILHALGRNMYDKPLNYAVTITIEYQGATDNLFEKTILKYDKLKPIKFKAVNEIMVKI